MKRILVLFGLMSACATIFAQQATESLLSYDKAALAKLPRLTMSDMKGTRPLPAEKDNTKLIFYPGIYSQEVWNCNQAASVWMMYTYEVNYLRGLESALPENQYSPMAVFNLLNHGNPGQGVSYFDSWNLIKANGIPGNPDFTAYSQNSLIWMTGYDKYYRGMKNRVDQVYALDVGTPDGLITLKHWVNDHLNGEGVGGLANFQIGSGDMVIPRIPNGLEAGGEYIVIKYGPFVGHAMTFAGWNDNVKYDVNGDGWFTNNIDINGDNVVDMKDWENGAMLVVNSWGTWWGNGGKVWVMYRLLAEDLDHGGIWNNAAMVVKPKRAYQPLLTLKTKIRYNERNRIKIQAGIASTADAREPEYTLDFPCFSFQGDTLPMQGFYGVGSDLIEIGLDITPLLDHYPQSGQAKFFLDVIQNAPNDRGAGRIETFSVFDYTSGIHEYVSTAGVTEIRDNALTRVSVMASAKVTRPEIITEALPDATIGQEYRTQIEADGWVGPFRFSNPSAVYTQSTSNQTIELTGGTKILPIANQNYRVMDLPFSFTLYGQTYTQVTILADGGIVMGQKRVVYPYVIDNRLPFYQNCGVFPFFGTLYYPAAQYQVTFQASATEAIIRWKACADSHGTEPVSFAARLLPNGTFGFYYGEMLQTPGVTWIAGVSEGNHTDFTLMDYVHTGLQSNTGFTLEKLNWPSWLLLGSTGDLKGTPLAGGQWQLPITLTDGNGISISKNLTLKTTGFSGIGADPAVSSVTLFPNPVTDAAWLRIHNGRAGSVTLEIFDLTGKSQLQRTFVVRSGEESLRCGEVASLPHGIYLYKVSGVVAGQGKMIR